VGDDPLNRLQADTTRTKMASARHMLLMRRSFILVSSLVCT